MPDPRLVGLHELRALIKQLNEANLRASTSGAHLAQSGVTQEDLDELSYVKTTVEDDLLPRCLRLLKRLQEGDTLGN